MSDAPFSVQIASGDTGGGKGSGDLGKSEILEIGNLGKRLEWGDRDET